MKTLVIVLMLIATTSVFAKGDKGKNKMSMEEKKTKVLSHIDKRIASLNSFKECVSAAKEKGDIKNCRKANRERMEEIRPKGERRRGN